MKSSIYVETSIVSYLTARPNRDLVLAAHQEAALPPKAAADAFHIAFTAIHGIDFLLTWNCTHIATRQCAPRLRRSVRLGVRHALVGGLAVGAHGYPRATKGVDFLVGDEAFEHHRGGS